MDEEVGPADHVREEREAAEPEARRCRASSSRRRLEQAPDDGHEQDEQRRLRAPREVPGRDEVGLDQEVRVRRAAGEGENGQHERTPTQEPGKDASATSGKSAESRNRPNRLASLYFIAWSGAHASAPPPPKWKANCQPSARTAGSANASSSVLQAGGRSLRMNRSVSAAAAGSSAIRWLGFASAPAIVSRTSAAAETGVPSSARATAHHRASASGASSSIVGLWYTASPR